MFFQSFDKRHQKAKEKVGRDPSAPVQLKDIFEDDRLLSTVASALGISNEKEKVSLSRLKLLEKLDAKEQGIESLEGIEFLNGLIEADLSGNQISRFPDYTKIVPNLYENRNSLAFMNLSNNPVTKTDNLFSLDATEGRKRFLNSFTEPSSRFFLGKDAQRKIFVDEPSPEVIHYALENALPASIKSGVTEDELEKRLAALLSLYQRSAKQFYGWNLWDDEITSENGLAKVRVDSKVPAFSTPSGEKVLKKNLNILLTDEMKYLIQALTLATVDLTVEDIARSDSASLLSPYFIKKDGRYIPSESFQTLSNVGENQQERARIEAILNPEVKEDYRRYLRIKSVLNRYLDDHPDKERAVSKLIRRSEEFTVPYLEKYLALQNNDMLSDEQKSLLKEAGTKFNEFVDHYLDETRNFFDQDVFDLEIEMKYIDMLKEAEKNAF